LRAEGKGLKAAAARVEFGKSNEPIFYAPFSNFRGGVKIYSRARRLFRLEQNLNLSDDYLKIRLRSGLLIGILFKFSGGARPCQK